MPPRDSLLGTLLVALILCIACSSVVSIAAVVLKPGQDSNKAIFKKKNVLIAAGFKDEIQSSEDVDRLFEERMRREFVDVETGAVLDENALEDRGIDPEKYDAKKAANDSKLQISIKDGALPGITEREPVAEVYKIVEGDDVQGYVLPMYGKGLWSTLYGFLALEADGRTVRGITYYEHKETPGLGGEVDNVNWQQTWKGKQVYDGEGDVALSVVKGKAADNDPYGIDGLSGATITSKGVDNMVKYWLGPEAFGQYLANN